MDAVKPLPSKTLNALLQSSTSTGFQLMSNPEGLKRPLRGGSSLFGGSTYLGRHAVMQARLKHSSRHLPSVSSMYWTHPTPSPLSHYGLQVPRCYWVPFLGAGIAQDPLSSPMSAPETQKPNRLRLGFLVLRNSASPTWTRTRDLLINSSASRRAQPT